MSLLRKLLEGAVAQINPYDNGQTFSSVTHNSAQTQHAPHRAPNIDIRELPQGVAIPAPLSPVQMPSLQPIQPIQSMDGQELRRPHQLRPVQLPKPMPVPNFDYKNRVL